MEKVSSMCKRIVYESAEQRYKESSSPLIKHHTKDRDFVEVLEVSEKMV